MRPLIAAGLRCVHLARIRTPQIKTAGPAADN